VKVYWKVREQKRKRQRERERENERKRQMLISQIYENVEYQLWDRDREIINKTQDNGIKVLKRKKTRRTKNVVFLLAMKQMQL